MHMSKRLRRAALTSGLGLALVVAAIGVVGAQSATATVDPGSAQHAEIRAAAAPHGEGSSDQIRLAATLAQPVQETCVAGPEGQVEFLASPPDTSGGDFVAVAPRTTGATPDDCVELASRGGVGEWSPVDEMAGGGDVEPAPSPRW